MQFVSCHSSSRIFTASELQNTANPVLPDELLVLRIEVPAKSSHVDDIIYYVAPTVASLDQLVGEHLLEGVRLRGSGNDAADLRPQIGCTAIVGCVAGRDGVDAKFRRANWHIDQLEAAVASFSGSEPFVLEEREEPETGDIVYRVRIRLAPPVDWSLLVGDAIHNARSALDHLAWALVERDGGKPGEYTCFPIADKPTGYGDRLRKALHGASQATRNAVRDLEPWQGGDERLWRLHRLDIIDKHRLLVRVGVAQRGILLGMTFAGFDGGEPIDMGPLEILAADRQFPLEDGAEVFRIMKAARASGDSPFKMQHAVTFDISLGDGTVVEGEALVPLLRDLTSHAATVVEPLVASLK